MSGPRVLSGLLAGLVLALGGCAPPVQESRVPTAATDPSTTAEPVTSTTTSGVEDPHREETPLNERTSVSIEIAGLPVGSGATLFEGDAWCGVFFWGGSLPAGVVLEISEVVVVGESGGTVLDRGCDGQPPCPGTVISVDTAGQGCGVTVLPPTSDSAEVIVRLDGTLHCPDAGTCDELAATGGSTAQLSRPEDNGEGAGGESQDSETTGELGREDSDATAEPTSSG